MVVVFTDGEIDGVTMHRSDFTDESAGLVGELFRRHEVGDEAAARNDLVSAKPCQG